MRRYLHLLSFILSFAVVFSCTDSNRDLVYNLNNPNANDIVGPRIVKRIDSADITIANYVTDGEKIMSMKYRNSNYTFDYNTSGKIAGFKVSTDGLTGIMETTLTYVGSRVTSATQKLTDGNTIALMSVIDLTYDSNGRIINTSKRSKEPGTADWTSYSKLEISYAGMNTSKIIVKYGSIAGTTYLPPMITNQYLFENYDNKFNPNTTLPKEFGICLGLAAEPNFSALSTNNALKTTVSGGTLPTPMVNILSYTYDSQNYPTGSPDGVMKIFYEAL